MTTEPLCLDASYLVALFDRRDARHGEARAIYGALRDHGALTVTPDCVMNEVFTVYARRCRERNDRGAFAAHVKLFDHAPGLRRLGSARTVKGWFSSAG